MTQPDQDGHTADQWTWHASVIADTLRRWRDGQITTTAKRREIADENKRYYGDHAPPHLIRTPRRYELPAILAEAAGVGEDVMTIALNARRDGGAQAYADILATALRKDH